MVKVVSVEPGSYAAKAGVLPDDYLISIDGEDINDILDYRYYLCRRKIVLKIHRGPELFDIAIKKGEYDDIGLGFASYLMDEKRSCRNKCIFCFIDQLPGGMRDTLYFKDDDSRLSFLTGSYITLTNLTDADIDRIIKMKISPINISVHTTDPELRCFMMKNRFAGGSLRFLRRLADAGLDVNAQIVLCRGVNDGEKLDRTMNDLVSYYPALQSVSVVPAGLTDHREGLYPLEPFTPEECASVIGQVNAFGEKMIDSIGTRLFYAADEFYIKSGTPLPDEDYYEGYPQLENGVGLITSMRAEFFDGMIDVTDDIPPKKCSIATGEAAYDFICSLVSALTEKCPSLDCAVYKIRNDFFGKNITVAGLVCGCDIAKQLAGKPLGEKLYIPSVILRSENDMFLDSMTLDELSDILGVDIEYVNNDGYDFISAILG